MAKKGRDRNGAGGAGMDRFTYARLYRDDIPEPRGKFRNLFAERGMMPKPKGANGGAGQKSDAPKSE